VSALPEAQTEPARSRGSGRLERLLGLSRLVPAVVVLIAGVLIPASIFFVYSFWKADLLSFDKVWNLANYRSVFSDPFTRSLILRTHAIGLATALMTVVLAFFTAYVISFTLKRGRNLVLLAIVISMLASYLVRVFAWILILGPTGVINRALNFVGLIDSPLHFLIYGKFAVALTLIDVFLPIAVLPIYAAMQSIDRNVLEASRDLGAGRLRTLVRVTLPLTWPGVSAAFVIVYILAASDYVTPSLVGGKSGIMVGRVVYDQFGITHDWPYAAALQFVTIWTGALLFLALTAFGILTRRLARRKSRGGSRVWNVPSVPPQLGRIREWLALVPWGHVYLALVLFFLFLPIAVVVLFSFSDSPIAAFPIRGLTGHWYSQAFGSESFRSALFTSLKLAGAVTAGVVICGMLAAFALERSAGSLRKPLTWLFYLPLAVPGIMIGFSILTMVTQLGRQTSLGSAWLGQTVYLVPFGVLVIAARLANFDRSLEEAARDLGRTSRGAFGRVTWPLISATVVGVAVLTFALSMDEFIITLYTIGPNTTLPILIWTTLQRASVTPAINAIASVLMAATIASVLAAAAVTRSRAGARRGRRSRS
jgi:ABC-type spermidine/putrescine transport system permease subunit I